MNKNASQFRAWDPDAQQMFYPPEMRLKYMDGGWSFLRLDENDVWIHFKGILMRSSEWPDKKGTIIYDKDILRMLVDPDMDDKYRVMTIEDSTWQFRFSYAAWEDNKIKVGDKADRKWSPAWSYLNKTAEVIGNIYKNTNMLEGEYA